MSAALRTGQRFGGAHLIDLLRGKLTDKMRQFGHDSLPTFGIGAELDEAGWRSVARQLLATGLLHADAHSFGALKLTSAARPVLKGETTAMLRRQVAPKKSSTKRPGTTAPSAAPIPGSESLFAALRQWRANLARQQGVPAYVILHDRTLRELAALRPATTRDLLQVAGIGEAKAIRYGAALLEEISRN
jgi:ATP-dependent DNA helicase RecQ